MSTSLAGRRVVVTRPRHQAAPLEALLRARGAEPVRYPCIAIGPPRCTRPLDEALRCAAEGRFDRLVLTSANAALAIRRRLAALALAPPDLRVAAVGPTTAAAALEHVGLRAEVVPDDCVSDALVEPLGIRPGERILLPQGDLAEPSLQQALERRGAHVARVEAYRTVRGSGGVHLLHHLRDGRIDAVTLASASSARHLCGRLEAEGGHVSELASTTMVCIGPSTAAAARRHGLRVAATATDHTADGLVIVLERTLEGAPDRRIER
jgi:uroporphyrinogen-III synthase